MTTTDSRRFALVCAFGATLFFIYQAWQKDYPEAAAVVAETVAEPTALLPDDEPAPTARANQTGVAEPSGTAAAPSAWVRVETDLLKADIALAGGELRRLELKGYPVSKDKPDQNLSLLNDRNGQLFVLQSGIAGSEAPLVTHQSAFTAAQTHYVLAEGADSLDVVLEHKNESGLSARKTYRFKRGSYEIGLEQSLKNGTGATLTASPYLRFVRSLYDVGDEPPFVQTFKGIGLYEQKENGGSGYRFRKETFETLIEEPIELKQTGGWLSLMQHYFLAAIVPPANESHSFSAKPAKGGSYMGQYVGAGAELAPGAEQTFTTGLYIGPKLQKVVGAVAPGLELTVDYGILTAISEPLFWLLDWFHGWTGNWGVAIILLTLAVKAALYKLSEAQYRSMAKMKKFAPRIQELKDRHGDDRQRMQMAMMDLYKKEGFNPLAGCWPILLQFPIFIALYWVLLESVELRQAEFMLWLTDLSGPDPYFVLPVLFGISMWVQQKLGGQMATMDPMQQKVMNAMPFMLTIFFTFFQSGLVLYWLVSNLIGIAQQWVITRKLEREGITR